MDIESIYVWKENEKPKANHHFLFPRSIRGLIVGKSNCGKTTLLNNLLLKDGYLDYTRLLVYGASLHQIEYKLMKAAFEKKLSKDQIRVLFERQKLVQRNGGPEKVIHDYDGVCKGNINTDFFSHGKIKKSRGVEKISTFQISGICFCNFFLSEHKILFFWKNII